MIGMQSPSLQKVKLIFKHFMMFFIVMAAYLAIQPLVLHTSSYFTLHNVVVPLLWFIVYIVSVRLKIFYYFILSFLSFLLYILAEKINLGGSSFQELIVLTGLNIILMFVFLLISFNNKMKNRRIYYIFIIYMSFILLPLCFLLYNYNDGTKVTSNILYALFQTNTAEVKEFISSLVDVDTYIILVIFILVIYFLIKKQLKQYIKIPNIKYIVLFILLLTIFAITNIKALQLPLYFYNTYKNYNKNIENFYNSRQKEISEIRNDAVSNKLEISETNSTIVIVIGESLNKYHMSIYGYKRNTTPYLNLLKKNNEILVFNNVYSNYVSTEPALSFALTNINQQNMKFQKNIINIVNKLKNSGYQTYWITNQNLGKGMVSNIAKNSDILINLNTTKDVSFSSVYDENIFNPLKKILLNKTHPKKAIFIHLLGSHADYCLRYPPKSKFNHFKGNLDEKGFGEIAYYNNQITTIKHFFSELIKIDNVRKFKIFLKKIFGISIKRINCYDNSVLYNDYVLYNIIELIKIYTKQEISCCIYFSDHSEDIDHQLAHNPELFTYEMTTIPMIMWFSEEYKKRYNDRYSTLRKNVDKLFCNDFVYNLILGISGFDSCRGNKSYDLTCSNYVLNENQAYTLHGKILYTDKENIFYWKDVKKIK